MNEPQHPAPDKPKRNYNRRKVEAPEPSAGLGVAFNPVPGGKGLVRLDIHMELPLALAIELASAAATVQAKAAEGPKPGTKFAGSSPFPQAVGS